MFENEATKRVLPQLIFLLAIALNCWLPLSCSVANGQTQFLVLKNGHEIEGVVVQQAKQTVVKTHSGSKLIFPNDKVDFVSPDLSAAYWQKVARIGPLDTTGHIELFHWCLDRSLHEQAGNQINLLMEMDVSAIKMEFLLEKLSRQRHLAANPPTVTKPSSDEPAAIGKVRQVTYEKEESISAMPSVADIQHSAAGLSPDSIRMYKRKVEPLLMRSCYTAGCHDAKAAKMPLRQLPGSSTVPKRMSQANLFEALKYIDTSRPFKNPFFSAAVEAHADQEKPIIRRGSKQFEMLRTWLVLISNQPSTFHSAAPPLDLTAPEPEAKNRLVKPLAKPQVNQFDVPPVIPVLNSHPQQQASPKDPFDPEVFNRRYGPSRNGNK